MDIQDKINQINIEIESNKSWLESGMCNERKIYIRKKRIKTLELELKKLTKEK